MTSKTYATIVGSIQVFLATVMIGLAIFTLWSIYKRLSLSFLRFTTYVLILCNSMEAVDGAFTLWIFNKNGAQRWQ